MEQVALNPYTRALKNCLSQFPDSDEVPELDETTAQFLANMIQGRFLQYLATRMCQYYEINDKEQEKQLIMVLMTILSDKFFVVFREKVKAKPEIVYTIARKITSYEIANTGQLRTDALYRSICKKYFAYENFEVIMQWINTNPEVEKIVFLAQVQKRIKDAALIRAIYYILQNDKNGVAPIVFNRYLEKGRVERLRSIVTKGDWKIEAAFVEKELSKIISLRRYMDRI